MSKIIRYAQIQEIPVIIDHVFEVATNSVHDLLSDSVPLPIEENVIEKAEAEARAIIAEAKRTAEQCLSLAQQEAAALKQQAHDEGSQQGYQEGKEAGYEAGYQEGILQGQQTGRAEMEQVIADAVAQSANILAASEQESKEMIVAAERQIVDIALAVSRKILAYEILENPMVVLPLVKAALQKVSDQEEVVIRVSVDDFDSVLMAKKDLQTMVGKEHALKIMVDHTIDSGSCIIDTSYGEVDARIDTQFETIKKALQGVA